MDLNGLIRLIFAKNDLLLGISISLLLIVTVLMLIRSVMEDRQTEKRGGGGVDLDPKALNSAIEGAMKKVLADKGIQGAIGAAAGASSGIGANGGSGEGSGSSADSTELKRALSEKEAKISALMSDLDALKDQIEASSSSVSPNGGAAKDGVDVSALQARLAELQAKLAEYEIIEDDIADLSLFKEENKKLKAELATLKAAVETAQTQVHAANVSVEAVPRVDSAVAKDFVQAAQAAVTAKPEPEKFALDENDAVMGEFAQAISGNAPSSVQADTSLESSLVVSSDAAISDPQAAIDALLAEALPMETLPDSPSATDHSLDIEEPKVDVAIDEFAAAVEGDTAEGTDDPLAGDLDTNKLQAEVSKLAAELEGMAAATDTDSSILDDQLDTDKLMAEMGMADEAPAEAHVTAAAAKSEKPQIVEAGAAPAKPASNAIQMEDDLLAEFKDLDFQSAKSTKGT